MLLDLLLLSVCQSFAFTGFPPTEKGKLSCRYAKTVMKNCTHTLVNISCHG